MAPAQVPKNAPPLAANFFSALEQAFFVHNLQMRGAFAARQNHRRQARQDLRGDARRRVRRPGGRASRRALRSLPEWRECRFSSCPVERVPALSRSEIESAVTRSRLPAARLQQILFVESGGRRGPSSLRRVLRRLRARLSRSLKCVVAFTMARARLPGSLGLEDSRADEHRFGAELQHQRGVGGSGDAAGGKIRHGQLAVLAPLTRPARAARPVPSPRAPILLRPAW